MRVISYPVFLTSTPQLCPKFKKSCISLH